MSPHRCPRVMETAGAMDKELQAIDCFPVACVRGQNEQNERNEQNEQNRDGSC